MEGNIQNLEINLTKEVQNVCTEICKTLEKCNETQINRDSMFPCWDSLVARCHLSPKWPTDAISIGLVFIVFGARGLTSLFHSFGGNAKGQRRQVTLNRDAAGGRPRSARYRAPQRSRGYSDRLALLPTGEQAGAGAERGRQVPPRRWRSRRLRAGGKGWVFWYTALGQLDTCMGKVHHYRVQMDYRPNVNGKTVLIVWGCTGDWFMTLR